MRNVPRNSGYYVLSTESASEERQKRWCAIYAEERNRGVAILQRAQRLAGLRLKRIEAASHETNAEPSSDPPDYYDGAAPTSGVAEGLDEAVQLLDDETKQLGIGYKNHLLVLREQDETRPGGAFTRKMMVEYRFRDRTDRIFACREGLRECWGLLCALARLLSEAASRPSSD